MPTHVFNPATEFSVFLACCVLVLRVLYELVMLVKKQGNGSHVALPLGCVYNSRDFVQLHKMELTQAIVTELRAPLEKQNELLEEIRDSVRELRPSSWRREP
jgi:hypothetical protein